MFQDICMGVFVVICITTVSKTTNFDPIKDSVILLREAKTELSNLQKGTTTNESDSIPFTNGEPAK